MHSFNRSWTKLNLAANTTVILTLCRAICTKVLLLHHTLPLQSLHIPVSNCADVHWTTYRCYILCTLGWIVHMYYPSQGQFRWSNRNCFWLFSVCIISVVKMDPFWTIIDDKFCILCYYFKKTSLTIHTKMCSFQQFSTDSKFFFSRQHEMLKPFYFTKLISYLSAIQYL